jgi:endonuclease III
LTNADGEELVALLRPLGLSMKRAQSLVTMSKQIGTVAIEDLPGVGPYALESVRVFCDGVLPDPDTVTDRKVAAWVDYHQRRQRSI